MKGPKYDINKVYTVWRDKLPDRIHIDAVYMKKNSVEWMYHIMSEQSCGYDYVSESQLNGLKISKRSSPVYNIPYVKNMYDNGFMWIGNYMSKSKLYEVIDELRDIEEIDQILVSNHAYDPRGKKLTGASSIWIKYKYRLLNSL